MLTDKEMLQIAERYLKKLEEEGVEAMISSNDTIKKPYGNIYFYNSKKFILTGDFRYAVGGNAPFLVEKEAGRVVTFSTSGTLDSDIQSYENGTMTPSLDLYWYPDEDRFDYK
ncbi:YrhB domain-containing protein [Chryseobacterium sp. MIQD13]|uniref:YrhB domain-containing protein n=1 Tax=Chryseobacterium sp. MIQD13 TaxID=3422310 RepID=UPI003D2D8736